jgi:hypothetical protein
LGFHFVVVLFGCFPASVLALRAFNRRFTLQDNTIQQDFHLWMLILFWVVIVLFSLVVTKIVHYSSLTYFPLTYLAALSIVDARPFQLWQRWLSWAVATVLSVALMLVPILGMYRNQLVPYIKDPFAVANLQADVQFSVLESLIGILPLLAIFCFYYYRKIANYTFAIYSIAAFGILLVSSIIIIYPAKIEPITQGAAVEFFQSLKGKDCYVQTLEYRSYVHLFYQQQPKPTNLNYYRTDFKTWLLEGDIDKDAYFSVKINKSAEYKKRKDLKVLYEKNGFVFLYRKAVGTNRY